MIPARRNTFITAPKTIGFAKKEYDYSIVVDQVFWRDWSYTYDSNGNQITATDNFSVTTRVIQL